MIKHPTYILPFNGSANMVKILDFEIEFEKAQKIDLVCQKILLLSGPI